MRGFTLVAICIKVFSVRSIPLGIGGARRFEGPEEGETQRRRGREGGIGVGGVGANGKRVLNDWGRKVYNDAKREVAKG